MHVVTIYFECFSVPIPFLSSFLQFYGYGCEIYHLCVVEIFYIYVV